MRAPWVTGAVLTCLALAPTAASTTTPTAAPEPGPSITWGECDAAVSLPWGAECGQMKAPLDYSDPNSEEITVTMARIKAMDPQNRKGTIFINPGGPGGSGVKAVRQYAEALGFEVQAQFDIVGIDPRGVGATAPFSCGQPPTSDVDVPVFAVKPGDAALILAKEAHLRNTCAAANPKIARFMTAADYARDLDRARAALGEESMNFVGASYGTYLAATYVNMFPSRVRAVVADSGIDPVAYRDGRGVTGLTTPVFGRLGAVHGAAKAIEAAFTDCEEAGQAKCAGARSVRRSWALLHSPAGKAATYEFMGTTFTYDAIAAGFLGGWYTPEGVVTNLNMIGRFAGQLGQPADQPRREVVLDGDAELLAQFQRNIERATSSGLTTPGATDPVGGQPGAEVEKRPAFGWFAQEMFGVMCSESTNPIDVTATARAAAQQNRVVPGEGAFRVWQSSACSHWPFHGKNTYRGAFDKPSANGVLVLSNTLDTATPHESGGVVLHETLPGSRLVTVEHGYGHGAMFYSSCARNVMARYLMSGELPAENVTCRQDSGLFPNW